jgi:hypothetical protein
MFALKVIAGVLSTGALCLLYSSEFGAQIALAIMSCLT